MVTWHVCRDSCSSGGRRPDRRAEEAPPEPGNGRPLPPQHLPQTRRPSLGYSDLMFEVLVYLYENYWRPDACPGHDQLSRKLVAVGFESDEIEEALSWLDGLASSAQSYQGHADSRSLRVYSAAEQEHLGEESVGFISFLESAGVLPPPMREMVLERAMAIPGGPIDLEDLKVIVLMVFWSLGEEPDALILDELFVDVEDRLIH